MPRQTLYLWKQAPFLRLVIPLIAGIVLQWYTAPRVEWAWIVLATGITGTMLFNNRVSFLQYRFSWINGLFINLLLMAIGLLLTWHKQMPHQQQWLNHYYHNRNTVIATLEEPPEEKTNSYKANAVVHQLLQQDSLQAVTGKIIIYFKKDSLARQLGYGSQIVFNQPLQPIKNTGNPGSFNYERYAAFQGIYQQIFLTPEQYVLLPGKNQHGLQNFLFAARAKVVGIIKKYIPGEQEAGLAEALLVGYKEDLDKTLVQSYTNTGVVHIIAISGMHLGLIYWLLNLLLQPIRKRKKIGWVVPLLIIAGLWLFALLAGGGPSILRSAVMFSCIVIGESVQRKTFIYNSLAASACILLCINPFWLWDAGFQLSYTALLSIVVFMKPIYNWFYFSNKIVDNVWKLMSVTLAAQVLTTPVSIYHFHQFPVYFLFTNLLAVPLSSLIVLGEIFLCAVSVVPVLAKPAGLLLHALITGMNGFIEHMEQLPFSLWNNLQFNTAQLVLVYGFITGCAAWLLKKNKSALLPALACLFVFFGLRTWSFINAGKQQQLIVYNIPRHQAIDFINGRNYLFMGDKDLGTQPLQQNAALNLSRTWLRASYAGAGNNLFGVGPVFIFNHKKIACIDSEACLKNIVKKTDADLIIISKNPALHISELMEAFNCRQLVVDASNAPWKVNKWKAEAAKLGLQCFYTVDNGAFVMNMD